MQPTRPLLTGSFGMVGSTHWLATGAAMSVLERGGNAFDAAAAGGFVLQVVEPHLNGPGGEVPIIVWSEAQQAVQVVCGQGVSPAAATIDAFGSRGLAAIPGTGLLAATVPGAFDGWLTMLERWGTWRLRDVLNYAISYARNGFPAIAGICATIRAVEQMFTADWPTSAAAWLSDGVPAVGSTLRSPGLADTYERIVGAAEASTTDRDGQLVAARDAWYRGWVADAFGSFSATHGGLLSADDLASWCATVEPPATYDYRGYTVCKTQAWGQGPVFLQQLALLDGFDLEAMGHLSPDYLHTVVECSKLAFADREAWYGDSTPDVGERHVSLLAPEYSARRRDLIDAAASKELRPGAPAGARPRLPSYPTVHEMAGAAGTGEPTVRSSGETRGDTCHIDVVDKVGNLVSATPSGGWLQSSPHIPELGFCLGTRAQMFWLEPGLPSSLMPGVRPRTTLSPSIALRDGAPWLAFGTPGGDQQDQWSLAFFLAVVHGGLDLQAAIEAPSYHSEHMPSSFAPRPAQPNRLVVEDRLGGEVIDGLRRRGHGVAAVGPWSLGRMSAVAREGDRRLGAANPRGAQGYAAGR
ncbi:MAG: gamma-glutamyltransferase [Solirubrobacterales bacterium]|nr:gamma-glutamyltransferase [Frankiaceae bacterium]MBV9604137.1 gamma-glutamyltransferase [Solirubrobacterales bacterium]MBV9869834.1 gamma-glutamyltransferase [Frankiaceae bacterium]